MWYFSLIICLILGVTGTAQGQSAWQKLEEAEASMREDRQNGVDVLSPKSFKKAQESLDKAKKQFAKDGKASVLLRNLQGFVDASNAAKYNAKTAKQAIPTLIKARSDAIQANAPKVTIKLFNDGEKKFREVVSKIEEGKVNDARKRVTDVETIFRNAELEAIKISTIDVAKAKLKEAERVKAKEFAPISYAKAESLITATDRLLSVDRYAGEQAAVMSQRAEYHSRLAIYLSYLARDSRDQKPSRERQYLTAISNLSTLAGKLGVEASYDEGFETPVNALLIAVNNLKEESITLSREVGDRNQRIEKLQQEFEETKFQLTDLRTQLSELKQKLSEREAGFLAKIEETQQELESERRALAAKRAFEQKIQNVEMMFTTDEGAVVQEKGNLIIRLYGLNFKSGQAVIMPEYFSLLSKVQRAIRELPNSSVAIQGNTDNIGYQEYNQKLSEDRANSVREYLVANMGLGEEIISAVGYGASQPIGNNSTEDGRAKNRRIDIVITPHQN